MSLSPRRILLKPFDVCSSFRIFFFRIRFRPSAKGYMYNGNHSSHKPDYLLRGNDTVPWEYTQEGQVSSGQKIVLALPPVTFPSYCSFPTVI